MGSRTRAAIQILDLNRRQTDCPHSQEQKVVSRVSSTAVGEVSFPENAPPPNTACELTHREHTDMPGGETQTPKAQGFRNRKSSLRFCFCIACTPCTLAYGGLFQALRTGVRSYLPAVRIIPYVALGREAGYPPGLVPGWGTPV